MEKHPTEKQPSLFSMDEAEPWSILPLQNGVQATGHLVYWNQRPLNNLRTAVPKEEWSLPNMNGASFEKHFTRCLWDKGNCNYFIVDLSILSWRENALCPLTLAMYRVPQPKLERWDYGIMSERMSRYHSNSVAITPMPSTTLPLLSMHGFLRESSSSDKTLDKCMLLLYLVIIFPNIFHQMPSIIGIHRRLASPHNQILQMASKEGEISGFLSFVCSGTIDYSVIDKSQRLLACLNPWMGISAHTKNVPFPLKCAITLTLAAPSLVIHWIKMEALRGLRRAK